MKNKSLCLTAWAFIILFLHGCGCQESSTGIQEGSLLSEGDNSDNVFEAPTYFRETLNSEKDEKPSVVEDYRESDFMEAVQ